MKKLNIALIILLLVFQTIMTPVSAFASEEGSLPDTIGEGTNVENDINQGDELASDGNGGEDTGEDNDVDGYDSEDPTNQQEDPSDTDGTADSTPAEEEGEESDITDENDDPVGNEEGNDDNKSPAKVDSTEEKSGETLDGLLNGGEMTTLNEDEEDPETGNPEIVTGEISNVTLTQFDMKIGSDTISEGVYTTPLPPDEDAQFNVTFDVMLNQLYGAGSYFEFKLPESLIDFDDAFEGDGATDGIAYSYTTTNSKVKVELVNNLEADQTSDTTPVKMTMTFKAGFNLTSDELQQTLELPKANSDSDTVTTTFTFLPKTSNETTSKEAATGIPPSVNGNHQMEWTVWVNKAGKDFVSPSLIDNPRDGHEIIEGSVNAWEYKVGLNGVKTDIKTQVVENGSLADVVNAFQNKHAYEIVYKTEVNLEVDKREDNQTFTNKITFSNNGKPETATAFKTITYGKAIDKKLVEGTNYKSTWEILFNYNEAKIDAGDAIIRDEITSNDPAHKHVVDTTDPNNFKVYEIEIENGVQKSGSTEKPVHSPNYTITSTEGTEDAATKFEIKFTDDVTKAYRIVYDAKYVAADGKDFYDKNENTTITNKATYNGKDISPTHTLSNALLSKSHKVDFAKKEIEWTITIWNDHPTESISNLTLKDQFEMTGKDGEHTLVGDASNITVSSTTDTPVVDADNKGFEITGISVSANSKVTVKYKTSFAITDEGAVVVDGYGNTATTTWKHNSKDYTQIRTRDYTPEATTVNNGTKSGKINYNNQEFTWEVRVNINKKDIQGAILTDEIGAGHQFVDGSLNVYKLTLGVNDETGTYNSSDLLEASNYTLSVDLDKKGYTLTFTDPADEAYVVVYKTKDSDEIFGIGLNESATSNKYTNAAKFETKKGKQEFTLDPSAVIIDPNVANNLIQKGTPSQDNSKQIVTWTLDVNKSHSNLGDNIVVEDTPSDNLLLIPDTIKIRPFVVTKTAITAGGAWQSPESQGVTVELKSDGGFTLTFPNLENKGYQVQYETIGLGQAGQSFSNEAKIHYNADTAENQKKESEISRTFNFSHSDSDLILTKGSAKFKKVGIDSKTGESVALKDVQFQLIKKIGSTNYVIRTATSGEDGTFEFNDITYGNYFIREVAAPTGYDKMADQPFKLELANDTKKGSTVVTTLVNMTPLEPGACPNFTLTIKDLNGKPVAGTQIKLVDGNGNELTLAINTTDANGQILIPNTVQAGEYKVVTSDDKDLGKVTVKFGDDCKDEIAPVPSCPSYTVTLKDENGPRKNVEVTIKDAPGGNVVATKTTDEEGKFTLPTTTPAGKYYAYESNQFLGEVNVDYLGGNCGYEFIQAPKCEVFTLTVRNVDGEIRKSVDVVVKDKDSNPIGGTYTTDANGQITIANLEPGAYVVYEADGTTLIDEFTSNIDCEASVQPKPTCPVFTVVVKDKDGNPRPNVKVTIKNSNGDSIVTNAVTNENGEITLPNTTPAGTYTVHQGDLYIGEIKVSYKDSCQADVSATPSCPAFTLTLHNSSNKPRAGVDITIKDANGESVKVTVDGKETSTFTTNEDGEVSLPKAAIQEGTYKVYEGTKLINSFKVSDTCEATVKPKPTGGGNIPPPPTCPVYTITVKDADGQVREDVAITLKDIHGNLATSSTTDANGQITVPNSVTPGEYTVFEGEKELGKVVVNYTNGNCQGEVTISEPPTCPEYTITVKDEEGEVRPNVTVTVKDSEGNEVVSGTTDDNGKVTVPNTVEPGEYTVFEGDTELGKVTIDFTEGNCEGEVDGTTKPTPPTCPVYTITVKDEEGNARPNVAVTVKDSEGNEVVSGTTDDNGKVTVPNTVEPGEYTVFEGDTELGKVTIDFTEGNCEGEVDGTTKPTPPTCPVYTITVKDEEGNARPNVPVTLKDQEGNEVASGITDGNGQVTVPNTVEPGEYTVFEGDTELGKVIVDFTEGSCEGELSRSNSEEESNERGEDPNDPSNPGGGASTPPGKDSNNPGGGGSTPPGKDPNNPGGGGSKTPPSKDPNNPGGGGSTTPPSKDPNNPGGGGSTTPPGKDPNNPGEEGSTPGTPGKNPNQPGEEGSTPGTPGENPNNPGEEGSIPGTPGENPNNPGEEGSIPGSPGKDPNSPDEEESAPITQDGNKNTNVIVKEASDSKTSQENNNREKQQDVKKLPQTDGHSSMYMMLTGALLVLVSSVLLFRRKKTQM